MKDLLGDIPAWAKDASDSDSSEDEVVGDIEKGKTKPTVMDHFFREVDNIKGDIDAVSKATKQINKINEQAMRATTSKEESKLSKKLKPLIDATNNRAKRTKTLLGLLKEETENLQRENKISDPDLRWVATYYSFVARNQCRSNYHAFHGESFQGSKQHEHHSHKEICR
mmetsp:Transcript_13821/g.33457  ORF Transcript_13821/g.33457 Transcript_13821/m.33457 type:complete len:169 (+) Transcript_13821:98-604(+)